MLLIVPAYNLSSKLPKQTHQLHNLSTRTSSSDTITSYKKASILFKLTKELTRNQGCGARDGHFRWSRSCFYFSWSQWHTQKIFMGGFIQWHLVVIWIWCTLFETSQFDVIFMYPNQRFGEVCWHNRHILVHALPLFYVSLGCIEYKLCSAPSYDIAGK